MLATDSRYRTQAARQADGLRRRHLARVRRGQPLHVVFKGGPDWCYALASSADCDCRVQQPCRVKTVRGSDLRGLQLMEWHDLRFDPASGLTRLATVRVSRAAADQRRQDLVLAVEIVGHLELPFREAEQSGQEGVRS